MTAGDLPVSAHVGRTTLVVNDLDELTAFYRDVVGLDVIDRDGEEHATLGAGGDPLLLLREDPSASQRPRSSAGLFHTAFRVPDRAALGDALRRIRDEHQLGGASDHLVSEALYLTDPEGNGVEIYRDRSRQEWPTTDEGMVQMDTVALDLDVLESDAVGTDGVPADTDIGHVHLEVTELEAARGFYVDTLGMNVRQAWGGQALFVAAGDYHHHVGLNTWHNRSTNTDGRGLDWFEVVVPDEGSLADVRSRFEHSEWSPLTETGWEDAGESVGAAGSADEGGLEDAAGVEGEPGFVVRDSDGIEVRVRIV